MLYYADKNKQTAEGLVTAKNEQASNWLLLCEMQA